MFNTEHLTIDTPEQIALELPVAGIGSRFLALAVDTLAQAGLYGLIIGLLVAFAVGGAVTRGLASTSLGPAIAVLLAFSVYWGYFAIFEIVWKGQTPGKRVAGIRVIKDTGRPIDGTAAMLRNLMRAIDFMPALYATGVICMMFNRHSRRLGDFVAGTIVVHDRATKAIDLSQPSSVHAPPASTAQAALISDEEVVLIETYLARRLELNPLVQRSMAMRLTERLMTLTKAAPAPGQSLDDFLESMARQARDAGRYKH